MIGIVKSNLFIALNTQATFLFLLGLKGPGGKRSDVDSQPNATDIELEEPPTDSPVTNPLTMGLRPEREPAPSPPQTASTAHVTECATIYSSLMACITTGYTVVYAGFTFTSDEREQSKLYHFWGWK